MLWGYVVPLIVAAPVVGWSVPPTVESSLRNRAAPLARGVPVLPERVVVVVVVVDVVVDDVVEVALCWGGNDLASPGGGVPPESAKAMPMMAATTTSAAPAAIQMRRRFRPASAVSEVSGSAVADACGVGG
jgi:hypothetical protein